MSLKISDLEALNTVTIGQTGLTPRLQVLGSNAGGLAEIYVTAGSGNALRLNTNFSNGNYIDINPYITGVSNGGFEIVQSGTQRFVITAGGNVGIGTTTDAGYKLDVNGVIRGIMPSDPATGAITAKFLSYSGNPYGLIFRGYASGTHSIQSQRESSNSEVFPLSLQPLGGNVAINKTSAFSKLEIAGQATSWADSPSVVFSDTAGQTDSRRWLIGNVATDYGSFNIAVSTTNSDNPVNPKLTILKNGDTGIGTANPNQKLQVAGNINVGTTLPMLLSNDTSESNLVNGIYYTTDDSGYGFAIGKIVSGTKTKQFVVRDSGNVLINSQSDNGYRLQVTGGISTTTNSSIAGTFSFINLENNSSKLSCSRFLAINDNGQNVGIGYNSDSVPVGAKLSVNGNAYFGGSVRAIGGFTFDYGAGIYAVNYTYSNVLLTGYDPSAGDFVDFYTAGSGVSNATKKIRILNNGTTTFYGNVYAPAFFNSSDIRLKEIVDYDYNISDIKPISYLWKDLRDNKKHVGYSAQEVQKVMPDAVNEDADGMLSVNYIEVLVAKIAELENRIKQLEK